MSKEIKSILQEMGDLKTNRSNWIDIWQVVGEYVSQIKQDFEVTHSVGEFLNEDIFDSTGTFAAKNSASAILGMLWSSGKKSFKVDPPEDMEDVSEDEKRWFEEIATKRLARAMDSPKSSLTLSLEEYMSDQVIFATSGVGVFWEDDALFYRPFSVKDMLIDEGKGGRVDRVYITYQWTITRLVETYGEENVSKDIRDKFTQGANLNDKVEFVIVYRPRKDIKEGKSGNQNMPFESIHFEKQSKHVMKRGGFDEFPVLVGRFRKLINEKYGRGMAMDALPDIREINVLKEAVIVATEKILDPPLGLMNSGILGNGVVDTSSGALTVFDSQGSTGNSPPIFPINTIGDMNASLSRIEALEDSIAQHFNIDRLLDFNNNTQMTATETVQRANIRNNSLTSLITRQIVELFTPLVERSFNLMLRNDQFGFIDGTEEAIAEALFDSEVELIPERIAERLLNGEDAYIIRFTTPADRVLNAEELEGLLQTVQFTQGLMQTHPEAAAYLDIREAHNNLIRLNGAPPSVIKSQEEVDEQMAEQAEQQQQQAQLNQAEQMAGIVGNVT